MERWGRVRVNPYAQNCAGIRSEIEGVKPYSEQPFDFYQIRDADELAGFFCPIELAHRYPDKFDPHIQPVVNLVRSYFMHPNTHSGLRNAYQYAIETRLHEYIEQTGAGGRISVCVRYDTAEQLQAVLPLLYFNTRYPCEADDTEGTIRALPPIGNRTFRASFHIITYLWRAGFEAERHVVLDDTTLFLEFTASLSIMNTLHPLQALQLDATKLEGKLRARSDLPDDDYDGDYDKAAIVYLLQPLEGKWRAGALQRREDKSLDYHDPANVAEKELMEGDSKEIDAIVNLDTSIEKKLETMISVGYPIILEKGHPMSGLNWR